MGKLKKIAGIVMAVMMVLGMSITSFAATKNTATIMVTNAAGATLSYAQLIRPDTSKPTGWAFVSEAVASAFKTAFAKNDDQAVIRILEGTPDANLLGKALSNAAGAVTFEAMENPQTVTSAGIYAIKATESGYTYNNMAAYVGFGEVTVDGVHYDYPSLLDTQLTAKKTATTVTKAETGESDGVDDDVVGVGDVLTYTIHANVPYINPNDINKTFSIYDTLNGAEYILDDTGYVAGTVKNAGTLVDADIIPNNAGNGFSIDLSGLIDDANSNAGNEIVVEYQVIVNGTVVTNTAASHVGDSTFGGIPVNTYSGEVTLIKYGEDETIKLAGAGFNVTKNDSEDLLTFAFENGVYTYDPQGSITEVVTGDDGSLKVQGLNVGTYHFTEITAPKGYSINEIPAEAEISVGDNEKATGIIVADTSMIDTKLSSLPSTGGMGTYLFTIGGAVIMAGVGIFFLAKRNRAA